MLKPKANSLHSAVAMVIGTTILTVHSAQAAIISMDLSFFNRSGQQIGQGLFTYDDQSPIDLIQGQHQNLPIDTSRQWYFLKEFRATIQGITWGLPYLGIWDAQNSRPQSVVYDNYGNPSIIDRWLVGDYQFLTTPALNMGQQSFDIITSNQFIEGNWTARQSTINSSAVPEAPTILGSLTAIGMLTLMTRVVRKNKH